jgi:hypothetical protein
MTFGKAGLLIAGIVAAFALGVMASPTIRDSWDRMNAPEAAVAAPSAERKAPAAVTASRPAPRARASSSRAPEPEVVAAKKAPNTIQTHVVDLWEPEQRDRAKAVLNPGARLEIAVEDFDTPEQFMTVAHAARNTNVPFMVLKDRVVNRGQSLAEAIREIKPELDAKAEVTRARAAARSDLGIAG